MDVGTAIAIVILMILGVFLIPPGWDPAIHLKEYLERKRDES